MLHVLKIERSNIKLKCNPQYYFIIPVLVSRYCGSTQVDHNMTGLKTMNRSQ